MVAVVPKLRLAALHVGSPQPSTPSEDTVIANVVSASTKFEFAICHPVIFSVKEVLGRSIALKAAFALALLSRSGLLIANAPRFPPLVVVPKLCPVKNSTPLACLVAALKF